MLERVWTRRREGEVSLSMVSLVLSLSAALVLGLTTWVPKVMARDIGITDVQPGLLEVAQNAFGVQSLGAGLTVTLYDRGFRLSRGSTALADTVTKGAPVIAMTGEVDRSGDHPREQVDAALTAVSIAAVNRDGERVTYSGVVHDVEGTRSLPLSITFEPSDGRIAMDVKVEGASAIAVNLDWRPATTGIAPALPERNLKERAYWVDPTVVAQPAFTWVLGTDVSIGPVRVPRAVDLRQDGRIAIHVWSSRALITVTDTPREPGAESPT